ncbi:hypothetical protein FGB62_67g011 [Gracilaria domingensis]|nr:hypothetical protein FGB62_67g011 [Gracilaria domingensis]
MLRFAKLRRGASSDVQLPPFEPESHASSHAPANLAPPAQDGKRSVEVSAPKKSLRSLFKQRPRPSRKQSTDEVSVPSSINSTSPPSASASHVPSAESVAPAMTPEEKHAKEARRKARRAERERRERERDEENRERRNQSIITGVSFDPLPPLSEFDSASEDEREMPPTQHKPNDFDRRASATSSLRASQEAPHLDIAAATLPRSRNDDVKLAEMFGAQALLTAPQLERRPTMPSAPPTEEINSDYVSPAPSGTAPKPASTSFPQASDLIRPSKQPAPIGWGDAYDTVPSQPLYGTPSHLTNRGPTAIEPALADKISRGRELAMLAIEQEEQGNMGAAEAGYMKALGLLVPASKELDIGSELSRNARSAMKAKIQREAAAMLDRCEQLRLFLKAAAPAVPTNVPDMPKLGNPSSRSRGPRGISPPRKTRTSLDEDPISPDSAVMPPRVQKKKSTVKPQIYIPPPPPPTFEDNPRELFQRIEDRKNVLSAASVAFPPASDALPKERKAVLPHTVETHAKCFMCNETAHLSTPCNHKFCSICGNQAVSVFGKCPVPGCTTQLTTESFTHILPKNMPHPGSRR